jgi:tRNA(Arg) A34 adenosine deaminase TadA
MIEKFMREAINLSLQNVRSGHGGPFGAVVVRGDEIIGRGSNSVTAGSDPTAHAEIVAIRAACQALGSFQLGDCELYASCEPCPMCLGAIHWARLRGYYYANTRAEASRAGFDDSHIYDEISRPAELRSIPSSRVVMPGAAQAFEEWMRSGAKTPY